MTFDPFSEKGIPLDRQLRNWSELNVKPYDKYRVHPYTQCRVITMNGIEVESILFSHQFARHCPEVETKRTLAEVRRIEQQQQKAVNWLIPGSASVFEDTIGYEQVAVDLTAWVARNEPDPYARQAYEFGMLEDFDHLYRYANLLDLLEGKKAAKIVGSVDALLTEVMPGRPTSLEHRHPHDEIRTALDSASADPQSLLNALLITSSEQQTMNYYMNVGVIPEHPLARALYLEIAQIEEQHVSHYESLLDPKMSWLERWALHEYNECYIYYSWMQTETDPRIRAIWELHLAMEIEHLRLAREMLQREENRDAREFLPQTAPPVVTFEPNIAYVRDVLAKQVDLTADGTEFVPVSTLPEGHRYFQYQAAVNSGGAPSDVVIEERKAAAMGLDYRAVARRRSPEDLRVEESHRRASPHAAAAAE